MINLHAYHADFGGSLYYRIKYPLHTVINHEPDKWEMLIDATIDSRIVMKSNITIFQRIVSPQVLAFMKGVKRHKIKIVVEIDDDLFSIPDWNPAKKAWGPDNLEIYRQSIELADALFVSTESLKQSHLKYNPNIAVLPNCVLPKAFLGLDRSRNNKKLVVGWHGTVTHHGDLVSISKVLQVLSVSDKVILKTFGASYPNAYFIPPTMFEDFYALLGLVDFDIGLAPLADIPFNEGKSNIKWMEYSMVGTPTIASAVGPYRCIRDGVDGFQATSDAMWIDRVVELMENPELGAFLVANAKERIAADFNMETKWPLWSQALQKVLDGEAL